MLIIKNLQRRNLKIFLKLIKYYLMIRRESNMIIQIWDLEILGILGLVLEMEEIYLKISSIRDFLVMMMMVSSKMDSEMMMILEDLVDFQILVIWEISVIPKVLVNKLLLKMENELLLLLQLLLNLMVLELKKKLKRLMMDMVMLLKRNLLMGFHKKW